MAKKKKTKSFTAIDTLPMEPLKYSIIEERQSYRHFNANLHNMGEVFHITESYLPYHRMYTTLSLDELRELIAKARENHWQALDLSCCGLYDLPDELWELTELRLLFLGNTHFSESHSENHFPILPRKIEKLVNLQALSLGYMGNNAPVVEYSRPLNLPNLRFLELYDTYYPQLPEAFAIPSLEGLATNRLLEFPTFLCSLPNIRELYLESCFFHIIPARISLLSNLEHLSLSGSQIDALPPTFLKLTNLKHLNLRSTSLALNLPDEIFNQSPQEIIRHILLLQSDSPREYFNEAKLILVGQPQVGKSSLLERLVFDSFSVKPSTEGINIETWHFPPETLEYRLNVWDFGGQEIYHATHQFFLTRRSMYLLVWDALSEDEYGRIDYWLRTIQSFADDCPIFIVVNKCDDDNGRRKRLYLEDYQDRYPQVLNIYEVSCRDGLGIDRLRQDIQKCAMGLSVMKTPWLTSWLKVRQILEDLASTINHISYGAYVDICKEQGVSPEDALSLAKYLHDLGVILYYHDDLLLRNLVILSTEWGTDAVYKILDEQERHLKGRNGILHPNTDLEQIWTDKDKYPRQYYPHLLNLMKNFQLSFPIENGDYLVAELLDGKPVNLGLPFEYNHTLRFRYSYDFMPAGILTRFIVTANEYLWVINGVHQCWKKGAYLRSGNAYALVQLFDAPPDRHIMIQVSGPNPRARQELLTVIRQKLDRVNGMFHKIAITRQIPCICSPRCTTLFTYENLLRAEQKEKQTVECQASWTDVNLKKLLDGVEIDMNTDSEKHYNTKNEVNPVFSPVFSPVISPVISPNFNVVPVSQDIRDLISALRVELMMLGDKNGIPTLAHDSNEIKTAMGELDNYVTVDEVKNSGSLKKLSGFLEQCADPNSKMRKALTGAKYATDTILNLGRKYNSLATLIGAPTVPLIGSK